MHTFWLTRKSNKWKEQRMSSLQGAFLLLLSISVWTWGSWEVTACAPCPGWMLLLWHPSRSAERSPPWNTVHPNSFEERGLKSFLGMHDPTPTSSQRHWLGCFPCPYLPDSDCVLTVQSWALKKAERVEVPWYTDYVNSKRQTRLFLC